MFEHVEQGDQVIGAVGNSGQLGKGRVGDFMAEPAVYLAKIAAASKAGKSGK